MIMDSSENNKGPRDVTFADKNAEHFNAVAHGSWPQWVTDLHNQIEGFLTSPEGITWLGVPTSGEGTNRRMLDYACGDGLVSRTLLPRFDLLVGADVSTTMLDKFRATAQRLGLGTDRMLAVQADLVSEDSATVENEVLRDKFDLVCTSMALHHFENPEAAMKRLAGHVKPGGTLLIIDWAPLDWGTPAQVAYGAELKEKGVDYDADIVKGLQSHAAKHTISKPNFSRPEMDHLFAVSGCNEFRWKLADELSPIPVIPDAKAQLFWARATKT